jgi:hypothetical protein
MVLTALKAVVPFEIELLPPVNKHLQSENRTIANPTRQLNTTFAPLPNMSRS